MSLKHVDQWTLGEFVSTFKEIAESTPDMSVIFDFNSMVPGETGSYRGYYEDLAINPVIGKRVTAKMVYDQFCALVGTYVCGWKGGEYRVTPGTALWVADSGNDSGTAVVGVNIYGHIVVIETAYAGWN